MRITEMQIVNAVASANIDLKSAREAGRLRLVTYLPETAGLQTHLYKHSQVLRESAVTAFSPAPRDAGGRAAVEGETMNVRRAIAPGI